MIKKRRMRKRKGETPFQLKQWLLANPKSPAGGRSPKKYHAYLATYDEEKLRALALACCQIMLRPSDKHIQRRKINLVLPWDYRRRWPDFPLGRFVERHESGWWETWTFNPYNLLDYLHQKGYSNISAREFGYTRAVASSDLTEIEKQLDNIIPSDVYSMIEDVVVNMNKEKNDG